MKPIGLIILSLIILTGCAKHTVEDSEPTQTPLPPPTPVENTPVVVIPKLSFVEVINNYYINVDDTTQLARVRYDNRRFGGVFEIDGVYNERAIRLTFDRDGNILANNPDEASIEVLEYTLFNNDDISALSPIENILETIMTPEDSLQEIDIYWIGEQLIYDIQLSHSHQIYDAITGTRLNQNK